MKYLFRGGTVVSGRGTRRADILVEGEKIVEVGRNITRKADQIIDVTGDRKSTRLNSSHRSQSRMPSSA